MPKWISVEKAVIKYHIEKEAILLWVEMGQFPMLYIDNVPNVDEECILELFRRSKAGITAEYIDTLEQLCIDKTMVCEKYAHIIQLKEKEIQLQKEINTSINEIQAAMKRQNERIRDLKKAIGENNNVIRSDSWIKRQRKRLQWRKRAALCPLQPISIPSTAFFKLLHKLFKAYIQTMKKYKIFYSIYLTNHLLYK